MGIPSQGLLQLPRYPDPAVVNIFPNRRTLPMSFEGSFGVVCGAGLRAAAF